ncbi:MAG TPA: MlaD family protein [Streptosporangiaceae bacterium]|jgi:phospholipid/cholesterol/gamma-HCH transport system substrate-binding protein|nr:MlaD family protein [Streptosporangiaceae bacterium]
MSSAELRRLLIRQGLRRLALAAGFAAVVVAVIVFGRVSAPASYLLRIPTQDASGIYAGSDVTIAGVNVGTVRNVSLAPDGEAMVTASIDPAFAPVHTDATAQLRPKSLLGEMYVDLNPGTSGSALSSGATLPQLQVNRSTDLQQVFNTFDQPTRAKLQTLIDELGGGLTGLGGQLNQAIPAGKTDIGDLAAITSTLNARNQELQTVIATLNTVTTELARSDRRQQLGLLIQTTQQLMANLRSQQAQLQRAVVSADYALGNLNQGLQGTAPALSGIAATLPGTVQASNLLLTPLDTGTSTLMPQLSNLIRGIQWGPSVFGGRDANGYATRISLVLGCGSTSLCPQLTSPLSGTGTAGQPAGSPAGRSLPSPATSPPATGKGAAAPDQGILGFLLGGTP